ncbi:hypothetical protein ABDI04_18010 [Bacillus licheniformis]|uniref:hypothetical protein n=1 Tax=Bacillus licheniformis TaxID=1402 RepID=UPI000471495C|nr:hypothetical protein [Bacillus licheniformis]MED7756103.1 hypothetical protein [Bacillus licheniformis]OKA55724.1 hypothetical protein BHT46_21005 [Bacillus licheniformis]
MDSNYEQEKSVKTYIKKRYGKIKGLTFKEHEKTVEKIIQDHSKVEIKRMLTFAQTTIDENNGHQSFFLVPYTILVSMLTVISSVIVSFVNTSVSSLNPLIQKLLADNQKKMTKEELIDWYENLTFSDAYLALSSYIAYGFVLVLVGFFTYFFIRVGLSADRYRIKAIMQDCLDTYDEVMVKQVETDNPGESVLEE